MSMLIDISVEYIFSSFFTLQEHLTKCDYRKLPCPNSGCNIQLLAQDLQEHIERNCLYKKIPCQWCEMLITEAEQKVCFTEMNLMLHAELTNGTRA